MAITIHDAVKELRKALSLSQQAFATKLGLSIRAIVNYEKDRAPTARALAQLEKLAADNDQPELARLFADALAGQLGLGMSDRLQLSAEELYLDRAFRRCVFENARTPAATQIRKLLQPFIAQIRKEDDFSSTIIAKRRSVKNKVGLSPTSR